MPPVSPLGLHSPVLERARRLRERDGRRESGSFLIEGPTLLADAVAAGTVPETLFGTAAALGALPGTILDALSAATIYEVPARAIERLSGLEHPPGLVAVVPATLTDVERAFARADGAPIAIFAALADPGNAGTLLRSAEIFGVRTIVFAEGGVEPYHPKVVRAAMGAHFRSTLVHAAGEAIVAAAGGARYTVIAAEKEGDPLPDFVFPSRCAIAIGSERHGVARGLPHWDAAVSVPHLGAGESLNASIAGSIIFYSLSQQLAPGV